MSLRRLGVEQHRPVPAAPHRPRGAAGGAVRHARELQDEGKVRQVGLSEVSVDADRARRGRSSPIATVQNRYNLADRGSEDVLRLLRPRGASASSRGSRSPPATSPSRAARCDEAAGELGATPSQVALAWLLQRSPVMLPIPGTSRVAHLEENCAAAPLRLDLATVTALDEAV